jgi:hypothetical protein
MNSGRLNAAVLAFVPAAAMLCFALEAAGGPHAAALGARVQVEHSVFEELPFGDNDLTYALAYEYHEKIGYWQAAVAFTPDIDGAGSVDYAITPNLNLIFKDKIWRGGIGLLASYLDGGDDGTDWTDAYWQFILGVSVPLAGRLSLDVHSYYVFENWDALDEFDVDDLEFGGWLSFSF